MERVQKIIAHSGICSRRKAEELIKKGLVTVNDKRISLGDKADAINDVIRVKNRIISLEKKVYYMVHKPVGYVTTCYDPKMKNTIFALPEIKKLVKFRPFLNYIFLKVVSLLNIFMKNIQKAFFAISELKILNFTRN